MTRFIFSDCIVQSLNVNNSAPLTISDALMIVNSTTVVTCKANHQYKKDVTTQTVTCTHKGFAYQYKKGCQLGTRRGFENKDSSTKQKTRAQWTNSSIYVIVLITNTHSISSLSSI